MRDPRKHPCGRERESVRHPRHEEGIVRTDGTAVAESGMETGAITPIGLPESWPILIDKTVADSAYVIVGSGIRNTKLAVSGAFLASLPNATIVEGLGQPRA